MQTLPPVCLRHTSVRSISKGCCGQNRPCATRMWRTASFWSGHWRHSANAPQIGRAGRRHEPQCVYRRRTSFRAEQALKQSASPPTSLRANLREIQLRDQPCCAAVYSGAGRAAQRPWRAAGRMDNRIVGCGCSSSRSADRWRRRCELRRRFSSCRQCGFESRNPFR